VVRILILLVVLADPILPASVQILPRDTWRIEHLVDVVQVLAKLPEHCAAAVVNANFTALRPFH